MELPTVDLSFYLGSQESQGNECFKLKESLHKYGAVAIRDPRVREEDSEMFIDMLEKYFGQPKETKLKDCRPDVSYQVNTLLVFCFKLKF
jgi:isopenicillin N synthase-like dioxygenase